MDEERVFSQLINYDFEYAYITPGNTLSHNYLWDGYDLNNKFGPSLGESARMYTFITEYFSPNDGYYLIYLKKELIGEYEDYLKEYESNFQSDPDNYHFTKYDEYEVIDGKYLFCHQKLAEKKHENAILKKVNNFSEISFYYEDYQLVFCAKSKNAVIKENVSTAEKLNKPINLYIRDLICFSDTNSAPTKYEFENYENITQTNNEMKFNHIGELVEVFPLQYGEMDFANYPQLGMISEDFPWETISVEVMKKGKKRYLILPRYRSNTKIDLLDLNTNFDIYEDVFRNHKRAFLDAYYEGYETKGNIYVSSNYQYALYDYEKVKKIISGVV